MMSVLYIVKLVNIFVILKEVYKAHEQTCKAKMFFIHKEQRVISNQLLQLINHFTLPAIFLHALVDAQLKKSFYDSYYWVLSIFIVNLVKFTLCSYLIFPAFRYFVCIYF